MSDTLDVRIAHLEGAYEQVDKRLGGVESVLIQLRSDFNSSSSELRADISQLRTDLNSSNQQVRGEINQFRTELTARMDSQLHWLLGTILTTWVSLLLAIFFHS